jgi:hypothetical protein
MTRNNFVKRDSSILLSSFLAIFFLVACQKQPVTTFGGTFVQDNNNAKVVVADTFSTDLATVYLDSVHTAGTGIILVGKYTDPAFGKVASRSFFQIGPPSSSPAISNYATYDSVGLIMRINRSYYGDTTLTQNFTVNQVSSLYQLPYQQYSFYSNSSFPVKATPLGSADVTISPNIPFTSQRAGDSVKIKLTDALGKDLFNKVYNHSDTITNPANFQYYFRGLCISPGAASNGVIYGFRDTVILRVYYHEPGVVLTNKFIDFVTTNPSFQFNNITKDWTGTKLAKLVLPVKKPQTPPQTSSDTTGNAAYLQPATGLLVKLSFPTLKNLLSRPDYLSVLKATLTVRPVPGSFSTTWKLPPAVNLFATDHTNLQFGAPLSGITASGSPGTLTGDLVVDYLYGLNTAYTYDITTYIQQQIGLTTPLSSQDGLIMDLPSPANSTTFNRALFADKTYPVNQRVSLKIYYVSLYLNH